MDLSWVKITGGLLSAVELINKIDKVRFEQLLAHIIENVRDRADSGIFTSEELVALEKVLNLDSNEVTLLIKSVRYIIKRMTKFIMRPVCILNDLTNVLKMNEEKAQIFIEKYKILIKDMTEEYNITNLGNVEEVSKANWQVNLEMTSSKNQLEQCTCVQLSLQTNKRDKPFGEHRVEFDLEELKNFHMQIEAIQNEVDSVINT